MITKDFTFKSKLRPRRSHATINRLHVTSFDAEAFSTNLSRSIKNIIKVEPSFTCFLHPTSHNVDEYVLYSDNLAIGMNKEYLKGLFSGLYISGQFMLPEDETESLTVTLSWRQHYISSSDICVVDFAIVTFDFAGNVTAIHRKQQNN